MVENLILTKIIFSVKRNTEKLYFFEQAAKSVFSKKTCVKS